MNRPATIAAARGDARRESRAWPCRCPLHGGYSLVNREGESGRASTAGSGAQCQYT